MNEANLWNTLYLYLLLLRDHLYLIIFATLSCSPPETPDSIFSSLCLMFIILLFRYSGWLALAKYENLIQYLDSSFKNLHIRIILCVSNNCD